MKIALCQFTAGENKQLNLEGILRWVEQAASEGAQLVVFPEYAMFMPAEQSVPLSGVAEELDGSFVASLREAARSHQIAIMCNLFERSSNDRPFNTSVVIDRTGALMGSYRKVHMYDAFGYRESSNLQASDSPEPLVVELHGVRVGVLICYDLRFPEWARAYIDQGADLLVYAAGWPPGPRKDDHWNTLLRSRAIENTCYVAGVVQGPPLATGGSVLVDPMGGIEGELTNEDGLIVREISTSRIARVRELNPSLNNRVFSDLIGGPGAAARCQEALSGGIDGGDGGAR